MKLVGIDSSRARLEHARIVDGPALPPAIDSLAVKDGRIAAISMEVLLVDRRRCLGFAGMLAETPCAGQSDPVTDPVTVREMRFLPSSRR